MRHSRKQAVRRVSAYAHVVDFFKVLHHGMGIWFYVMALAIAVGLTGAIWDLVQGEDASAKVQEEVPDQISDACWAKRLRNAMRETTVDRYEREQAEKALANADQCVDE